MNTCKKVTTQHNRLQIIVNLLIYILFHYARCIPALKVMLPLLRLRRFKTTKLTINLKFHLLSFLLRYLANVEGFPPVVTKTAHKNSTAF